MGKKKAPQSGFKQRQFKKLAALYQKMEEHYDAQARQIGLRCAGCTDNCCTSYFQHHTYVEWLYLWEGIRSCPDEQQARFLERAREYVEQSREALARNERPRLMCPLNEDGWCAVYRHRLMICRLHGVPNRLLYPNGRVQHFPGCWRCQELTAEAPLTPVLDRTPLYQELVAIEKGLLGGKIATLPRVDMTLAEMLVHGPPQV